MISQSKYLQLPQIRRSSSFFESAIVFCYLVSSFKGGTSMALTMHCDVHIPAPASFVIAIPNEVLAISADSFIVLIFIIHCYFVF